MKLGIVIGSVWTSKASPEVAACRLLIVEPVAAQGGRTGGMLVAADPKNLASAGDRVIYVTSTDAAAAFASGRAPVNASIVGLVEGLS